MIIRRTCATIAAGLIIRPKIRAPAGALFICASRGPSYNKVMAGVPASFGIAVRGAAMCHPTSCNARRDCGVVA